MAVKVRAHRRARTVEEVGELVETIRRQQEAEKKTAAFHWEELSRLRIRLNACLCDECGAVVGDPAGPETLQEAYAAGTTLETDEPPRMEWGDPYTDAERAWLSEHGFYRISKNGPQTCEAAASRIERLEDLVEKLAHIVAILSRVNPPVSRDASEASPLRTTASDVDEGFFRDE